MPSKHLVSLTQHGGEAPILQYAPMCQAWAVTTYDACDIRCSYCHSLSQGVSRPKASATEVQRILERELPSVPREHVISLSPMVDCYPHAEAEHEVTRAALEVLVADGRKVSIATKGTLVERDLDLLLDGDDVIVNVALSSLDQRVLDEIEPHAPSAAERLAMVERLTDAGIETWLQVNPWIPGISDAQQFIDAADGRFTVWFAPLNVENPVVARTRWGKRFTQREVDEAYEAEMERIGRPPRVGWTPLNRGRVTGLAVGRATRSAGETDAAPRVDRRLDATIAAPDPVAAEERDLASTTELLEALASGRLRDLGLAKLSTHMRVYDSPYPERRVATEGPGLLREAAQLVDILREPQLTIQTLRAEAPVVNASYVIAGELLRPYRGFEAGRLVCSSVAATYRYDIHGLLIEHWAQAELQPFDPAEQVPSGSAASRARPSS